MTETERQQRRTWRLRFRDAMRGVITTYSDGGSMTVHLLAMVAVIGAGVVFRVSDTEWCVLVLCIASVLAAETFNSAMESLAAAVTREHDPLIGRALDMAAGAVLIVSVGAAVTGLIVFIPYARQLLN